jgi:hypothetical protein
VTIFGVGEDSEDPLEFLAEVILLSGCTAKFKSFFLEPVVFLIEVVEGFG